jgi:penicillin-binding protein 1A
MNFMQQKLGFTSLVPDDRNHLSVAIGGLTYGVTVREMTAGFQMFGNGGKYYQPYTYYYVTDHDGNVIPGMDNRSEVPTQAISSSAATIMNKLLNNVMKNGTGKQADISGWQTFGKTGTTDDNKDSWFVGGTPYAVAGVWTGYTSPQKVGDYQASFAKKIWKTIMSQYLADKPDKTFHFDPNVISAVFRKDTGLLAVPGAGVDTGVGWYDKNNLPAADSSLAASSSVPAESSSPSPESSSRPEGLWPGTSSDASQADSSSETTTSTVSESSSSAASSHSKAGDQKGNDVHGKSAGLT